MRTKYEYNTDRFRKINRKQTVSSKLLKKAVYSKLKTYYSLTLVETKAELKKKKSQQILDLHLTDGQKHDSRGMIKLLTTIMD